MNKLMITY